MAPPSMTNSGVVTGFISGFYTSYDGFIDFTPTGDIEDGLQVFIYTPKKATFYGGEARADFHLLPLSITKAREQSDAGAPLAVRATQVFVEHAKDLEDIGELAHHGPEDAFIAVMTLVNFRGIGESVKLNVVLTIVEITGLRNPCVQLDEFMPWKVFRGMTDAEIHAIWLYLRSVPAKPFGNK